MPTPAATPQLDQGQGGIRLSRHLSQRRNGFVYRRTFRPLAKIACFVYRGTVCSSIGVHPCTTKLPKNPRQHWTFSPSASKNGFFAAKLKAPGLTQNTRLSRYISPLIHRKTGRFVYRGTNYRLSPHTFLVYRRTCFSSIGVHTHRKNPCTTMTYATLSTA